ncbi:MAG: hypothetical protein WCN95_07345 [bacterium]
MKSLCRNVFAILACSCLSANAAPPPVTIDYFYQAGCADCQRVKTQVLPELNERFEEFIILNRYDVNILSNTVRLVAYQEALQIRKNEPVMMVVDFRHVFNGFDAIKTGLLARVDQCVAERLVPGWQVPEHIAIPQRTQACESLAEERLRRFALPAVLAAGFTDGINPCAIGTLVFFMSLLSVSGVKGRRLLLVGIPFCIASFVTYTAIGFGLMRFIHSCEGFPLVRKAVEAAMVLLLGIFAILSFLDAWRYGRSGNAKDVTLQLPKGIKERIHSIMRSGIRGGNLILGALVVGALVTVMESVCTGQVYVPTLVLVAKSGQSGTKALGYLLLYNLMFLVPLVTVFILTYLGLKTVTLLNWSKRNVVFSKVLMGAFFVAMAVLIALL